MIARTVHAIVQLSQQNVRICLSLCKLREFKLSDCFEIPFQVFEKRAIFFIYDTSLVLFAG